MIPTNLRQEQVWLVVGSLMILATVALAGALLYTRDVMIPFVLAIFITTMVSPLVDFLVLRWRLPGWLAILIALLVVLAMLTLLSAGPDRGRADDRADGRRVQQGGRRSDPEDSRPAQGPSHQRRSRRRSAPSCKSCCRESSPRQPER